MLRPPACRTLGYRAFACVVIASGLVAPSSARAQFGGLIKKAAGKVATDKAAKVASQSASPNKPRAAGEALTDATLTSVLTGARAAERMLGERDRVRVKLDADQQAVQKLSTENEGTRQAYEQSNRTILDCREAALNKAEEARNERLQKAMTPDAQTVARLQTVSMKYAKTISEAQQRGDTAAAMKAQMDIQREITGIDIFAELKRDSTTADTKCGKLSAMPAALAREEQLRTDINTQTDSIRTLEAQAINTGAQASGLDRIRYLELKERVASILATIAGQRLPVSYGDDEIALVQRRQSEIEPVKRVL